MRNFSRVVMILFFVMLMKSPAHAENKPLERAKRGLVNIVTAPVEIPKQVQAYWIEGSKKTPHVIVWILCGTAKGIANTVKRAVSGVVDLVTVASLQKEPMAKPNYVFQEWPTRADSTVVFHSSQDRQGDTPKTKK